MLHRKVTGLLGVVLTLLITGCATKTTIQALEPAEIDRSAALKQVAILAFDENLGTYRNRYHINFAPKLEALMANYQLDGKAYFVILSRNQLDRILDEQKLQHSGLVDDHNIVALGKLMGAQALISGSVSSAAYHDTRYFETRSREQCSEDGKGCQSVDYKVSCTVREIGLGIQIKMTDVEKGDLVTAQSFDESAQWSACQDQRASLPSPEKGFEQLSNQIAEQFLQKIAPRYVRFDVVLLDDPEVELTSDQKGRFKAALEFVEANRLDRAGALLSQLHLELQHKSYVIAYNLGVIKESEAAYAEAKRLYQIADRLALTPVDEINLAIERIERLIANQQRAQLQLNQ